MVKEFFIAKVKELKLLMNATGNWDEFAKAAWERIKNRTYTDADMESAMNELLESDRSRVNLPVLLKALNEARATRLDRESKERESGEHRDTQMFWERHKEAAHEPCGEHRCGSCPREKWIYCEDIALATLKAIQEKHEGKFAAPVSALLALYYPGASFEKARRAHKWARIIDGKAVSCDEHGNTDRKVYTIKPQEEERERYV